MAPGESFFAGSMPNGRVRAMAFSRKTKEEARAKTQLPRAMPFSKKTKEEARAKTQLPSGGGKKKPPGQPITTDEVKRILGHFSGAASGLSARRIAPNSQLQWSYIIRLEFDPISWEALAAILDNMSTDNKLIRDIGRRPFQIIATFIAEGFKKGRRSQMRKFASLSSADDTDISIAQAASVAEGWAERYEETAVEAVLFYVK